MITCLNQIFKLCRILSIFFFLFISCKQRSYKVENNNSVETVQFRNSDQPDLNKKNSRQNSITGKVVKISDGDTFSLIFDNGFNVRVRLNDIDCPEKKQAYSKKATTELSNLIFNKIVQVNYDKKDGFGRVLGDVFIGDLNVNREMLRKGLAWHYKKYSDNEDLAQLENKARRNKFGLWQDPNPVPPWEFRKRK